jgi:prephenate dehydrogenase
MTAAPLRVGVAGLGLIGGSAAQRLAALPERYAVAGFDVDRAAAQAARAAGLPVAASLAELATASDVVVAAVPPAATAGVVLDVLAASPAVVTDTASAKAGVLAAVAARAGGSLSRYLPGHPLAGSEAAGWEGARPDLLDGAAWALCPPAADSPAATLAAVAAVLDAFDARIAVCSAADHDDAVARTSHAPHVIAELVASAALGGGQPGLAALLSGGALRDMTRVAAADPALWQQILAANRPAAVAALDAWLADAGRLRDAVAAGDDAALGAAWAAGARARAAIDAARWRAPAWAPATFPWPAWAALAALAGAGRPVRRLRLAGPELHAEVAAAPA